MNELNFKNNQLNFGDGFEKKYMDNDRKSLKLVKGIVIGWKYLKLYSRFF